MEKIKSREGGREGVAFEEEDDDDDDDNDDDDRHS